VLTTTRRCSGMPCDLPRRRAALRKQIEAQLRSVLRERDFGEFDLERAFKIVVDMAKVAG